MDGPAGRLMPAASESGSAAQADRDGMERDVAGAGAHTLSLSLPAPPPHERPPAAWCPSALRPQRYRYGKHRHDAQPRPCSCARTWGGVAVPVTAREPDYQCTGDQWQPHSEGWPHATARQVRGPREPAASPTASEATRYSSGGGSARPHAGRMSALWSLASEPWKAIMMIEAVTASVDHDDAGVAVNGRPKKAALMRVAVPLTGCRKALRETASAESGDGSHSAARSAAFLHWKY